MIKCNICLLIIYMLILFNYLKLVDIIYSEKTQKKWPVFVGLLVPIVVIAIFSDINDAGKIVMVYVGSVLSFVLMISGNLKERMGKTLEMFFMSECLEGITFLILELSGVLECLNIEEEVHSYLLEYIIIALTLSVINYIKQKRKVQWQKLWNSLAGKLYFWIVIMAISMLITVSGLNFAKEYVGNSRFAVIATGFCVVSYISVGILSIFVFYIKRTNERMEQMLQREMLSRNMQQYYYEELLAKEEDTRRYRHDMINHLMCINSLAKEQKYEELKKYIQNMQEVMCHIQKKTYTVGNPILDIATNYYLNMLTSKIDIKVTGYADEQLSIDSSVLCTVYANLLSNAVEELKKVSDGYLHIDILQGDEYFQIKIVNSLSIESQKKEKILLTEKRDKKNHGFGLKNVQKAVDDNDGKLFINYDKEKFEVSVILKNL